MQFARNRDDYTSEEWRQIYDDTFNTVLNICTGRIVIRGHRKDEEDIKQQCELVFFECFYEWKNGDPRDFPPHISYFCKRCLNTTGRLHHGGRSIFAESIDPNDWLAKYAIQVEPEEPKMDYLDFYLEGVGPTEIGLVFHKSDHAIRSYILIRQQGLAKRDGEDVEVLRARHKAIHRSNRPNMIVALVEAGLEYRPIYSFGERPRDPVREERNRKMIDMRETTDMSFQAIADEIGVNAETVRTIYNAYKSGT